MNRPISWMICLLALSAAMDMGCRGFGIDTPPPPPRSATGESGTLTVTDETETSAATAVEVARLDYKHRLEVLQAYYARTGAIDKHKWTVDELKNLADAQTFVWRGLPQVLPPPGEDLQQVDEQLLVEFLVRARRTYQDAVEELACLYERQGQTYKGDVVRNMQDRLDPVRQYMYLLSAEIPPADLKPTEYYPQAEEMFLRAEKLQNEGKGVFRTFISTNYDKQRQALRLFRDLVEKYPCSNRIALSAFYIAEIYKEYFKGQELRAVAWYERAWQWDPNIPKLARSQCAFIYDIRLQNKARALECYRLAVQHETFDPGRVWWCSNRIRELERGD